jgi:glycosyltransferase involved in cell wall biosynthesis
MDGSAFSLHVAGRHQSAADRNAGRAPDHDLTLVIPAFNEARRLPSTLATVKDTLAGWRLNYEVIVVDDGSRDSTAELPAHFGRRFCVLRMPQNRGKGAAVRAGMFRATGAVAAFTDADLPFDLAALRSAYQLVRSGSADVVCGARDLAESSALVVRSAWRQCASWVFRAAVRRLLTLHVTDTQCGLKVFSRRAIESIFPRQRIDGLAFDVEVLYLAERLGLSCARIPVVQRNEYASTISLRRHALPMFLELLRIRAHDWQGSYHLPHQPQPGPGAIPPLVDPAPLHSTANRDAA